MYKRIFIVTLVWAVSAWIATAQTIELPDTLFLPFYKGTKLDQNGAELPQRPISDTPEPLFQVAPAVTFKDYIEAPAIHSPLFLDLPDIPSEFFIHVLILHLSKAEIPGLDKQMAQYKQMLDNFNRDLLKGGTYAPPYIPAIANDVSRGAVMFGGSGGIVFSGCLDPLEAYRRHMQKKRLERAKQIIDEFEQGNTPINNDIKSVKIKLPDLLKEDNYDIKVKSDGDNPPYRP